MSQSQIINKILGLLLLVVTLPQLSGSGCLLHCTLASYLAIATSACCSANNQQLNSTNQSTHSCCANHAQKSSYRNQQSKSAAQLTKVVINNNNLSLFAQGCNCQQRSNQPALFSSGQHQLLALPIASERLINQPLLQSINRIPPSTIYYLDKRTTHIKIGVLLI